jgi:purine catabolism regulator
MFTVQDLLRTFQDFSLLTDTQICKEVSSVSVMDAPDIQMWMKGGEFLITSGFTLATRINEFPQLIKDLRAKNVAALGIKVSRFMHQIPEDIIELANKLDFSIVEIPEHYAFTDIINPVLTELVNSRYHELCISEEINRKFMEIGVADVSYEKILNLLSRYVKGEVYYLNIRNQKIYKPLFSSSKTTISELQSSAFTRYVINYQQIQYGVLYVEGKPNSFQERTAITHAITMLRLSIQTILSSKRFEEQRRNDFLSDLILNKIKTKEEIDFRSQEYGWKLKDGVICAVFYLDSRKTSLQANLSRKRQQELELLYSSIRERFKDLYYVTFSDHVAFLLVGRDLMAKERAFADALPSLMSSVSDSSFNLTVGIGNPYEEVNQSFKSYEEAKKAIIIGRAMFGSSNYYRFSDLSIYDYFIQMPEESLEDFPFVAILKELSGNDAEKGTEYIKTLAALIDSDWIMSAACERLTVHYNTMKKRTAKIKEITGWMFNSREEKFRIETAYKIFLLRVKPKVH